MNDIAVAAWMDGWMDEGHGCTTPCGYAIPEREVIARQALSIAYNNYRNTLDERQLLIWHDIMENDSVNEYMAIVEQYRRRRTRDSTWADGFSYAVIEVEGCDPTLLRYNLTCASSLTFSFHGTNAQKKNMIYKI
ncbi:hypothetical protein BDA99DRAFT_540973 [Phascolomyces articulosus]|uniref:Uncharacterized protein n=1 Tax=Phascolomyces articulosus TaxID=60185 RepID=A0AAD5JTM1_9FUNG|nr:hypothetical protein BDA99DRAFT_540973 [Phascolomyces articulosus]